MRSLSVRLDFRACHQGRSHHRDSAQTSSMGWNEADKRAEVFHPLSRFLLAHVDGSRLAGFCIFRFEEEDGQNLAYW